MTRHVTRKEAIALARTTRTRIDAGLRSEVDKDVQDLMTSEEMAATIDRLTKERDEARREHVRAMLRVPFSVATPVMPEDSTCHMLAAHVYGKPEADRLFPPEE